MNEPPCPCKDGEMWYDIVAGIHYRCVNGQWVVDTELCDAYLNGQREADEQWLKIMLP